MKSVVRGLQRDVLFALSMAFRTNWDVAWKEGRHTWPHCSSGPACWPSHVCFCRCGWCRIARRFGR